MGGRHQAPKRRRQPRAGGGLAGAFRRSPADKQQVSAPEVPPPTQQQPVRRPPAQTPPRGEPVGQRVQPPSGPPRASWWVLAEVGGLALLIVIVAAVLLLTGTVVDWREPVGGAALLLAPILVRHIVLGVRRRWRALGIAYGSLLVVAVGGLFVGDLALPHTVAGFGAAVVGVLVAGLAFVLASRLFGRAKADRGKAKQPGPVRRPGPVTPPTAHAPVSTAPFHYRQDPNVTDTLPQVLPDSRRSVRDDDSLAG